MGSIGDVHPALRLAKMGLPGVAGIEIQGFFASLRMTNQVQYGLSQRGELVDAGFDHVDVGFDFVGWEVARAEGIDKLLVGELLEE